MKDIGRRASGTCRLQQSRDWPRRRYTCNTHTRSCYGYLQSKTPWAPTGLMRCRLFEWKQLVGVQNTHTRKSDGFFTSSCAISHHFGPLLLLQITPKKPPTCPFSSSLCSSWCSSPDPTVRAGEVHQVCSKHNAMSMLLTTVVVLLIYFPLLGANKLMTAVCTADNAKTRMLWIHRKSTFLTGRVSDSLFGPIR